ncbi:MAG: hypothetical protein LBR30_06655 [Clostridioides sp.]|jgi:hypothetical protein|nr:hypothetical protein [Clostridioides sp.]
MEFNFLENITPYKNLFEYQLYKYDDEIQIGKEDTFLANIQVVIVELNEVFKNRKSDVSFKNKAFVIVDDCKISFDEVFANSIKRFVFNELAEFEIEESEIQVYNS